MEVRPLYFYWAREPRGHLARKLHRHKPQLKASFVSKRVRVNIVASWVTLCSEHTIISPEIEVINKTVKPDFIKSYLTTLSKRIYEFWLSWRQKLVMSKGANKSMALGIKPHPFHFHTERFLFQFAQSTETVWPLLSLADWHGCRWLLISARRSSVKTFRRRQIKTIPCN